MKSLYKVTGKEDFVDMDLGSLFLFFLCSVDGLVVVAASL